MKITKILLSSFYKTTSSQIVYIPKAIKTPKDDYIEPSEWKLKFEKPSQVKPKAFIDIPQKPCEDICKEDKCGFKNPEYSSYHTYSYYDMERDLFCKRCRPQPSPYTTSPFDIADEKSQN